MRVDRQARVLAREALLRFREPQLVPQHVQQIGGVAAVEDAEARVQPDRGGVPADQPVGDRVERARPRAAGRGPWSWARCPGRGSDPAESPTMRWVRRIISRAARRVKVRSRMRSGFAPDSTRCATRCASVFVLPVPAPAMISSGPEPNCAASCCLSFNRSGADTSTTNADYRGFLRVGTSPKILSDWGIADWVMAAETPDSDRPITCPLHHQMLYLSPFRRSQMAETQRRQIRSSTSAPRWRCLAPSYSSPRGRALASGRPMGSLLTANV